MHRSSSPLKRFAHIRLVLSKCPKRDKKNNGLMVVTYQWMNNYIGLQDSEKKKKRVMKLILKEVYQGSYSRGP